MSCQPLGNLRRTCTIRAASRYLAPCEPCKKHTTCQSLRVVIPLVMSSLLTLRSAVRWLVSCCTLNRLSMMFRLSLRDVSAAFFQILNGCARSQNVCGARTHDENGWISVAACENVMNTTTRQHKAAKAFFRAPLKKETCTNQNRAQPSRVAPVSHCGNNLEASRRSPRFGKGTSNAHVSCCNDPPHAPE